jgi:hypothetical protein
MCFIGCLEIPARAGRRFVAAHPFLIADDFLLELVESFVHVSSASRRCSCCATRAPDAFSARNTR